jgi:hypothetical protein
MNMTIQLDPVAVREATSQAIMGILTPEMRASIIDSAIRGLLTPSTNSWERGKSPIELAFQRAVEQVAGECVRDVVKNDKAIMDKIAELAKETAEQVLNADKDKMVQRMTDAFVNSMRRD